MVSRSLVDQGERSVPFGKYWRSSPLLFSLLGAVRVGEVDWEGCGDRERGVLLRVLCRDP